MHTNDKISSKQFYIMRPNKYQNTKQRRVERKSHRHSNPGDHATAEVGRINFEVFSVALMYNLLDTLKWVCVTVPQASWTIIAECSRDVSRKTLFN